MFSPGPWWWCWDSIPLDSAHHRRDRKQRTCAYPAQEHRFWILDGSGFENSGGVQQKTEDSPQRQWTAGASSSTSSCPKSSRQPGQLCVTPLRRSPCPRLSGGQKRGSNQSSASPKAKKKKYPRSSEILSPKRQESLQRCSSISSTARRPFLSIPQSRDLKGRV